jgi:ketosteroid isomerase-like protein
MGSAGDSNKPIRRWRNNVGNEQGGNRELGESKEVVPMWIGRVLRYLACAFVLGISPLSALASDADLGTGRIATPPELARAIAAYDQATVDKDIVRLGALVRDDYVLVNSDMSIQNKQSYLEDFKVQGFRINQYKLSEPILIVRSDSALAGGFFQLSWVQDGRSLERRTRIIHFWEKDAGQWRLAYTQLTRALDK